MSILCISDFYNPVAFLFIIEAGVCHLPNVLRLSLCCRGCRHAECHYYVTAWVINALGVIMLSLDMLSLIILSIIHLSVIMLSVNKLNDVMLSCVRLNVIILSVIKVNDLMLSVIMPNEIMLIVF